MAPACPVFPPPRTVILISTESNILTHSKGCRTNILPVTRPKYSSRGFPFTFIFPSPDLKKPLLSMFFFGLYADAQFFPCLMIVPILMVAGLSVRVVVRCTLLVS